MKTQFKNFKEFYPFYLSEHQHPICRALHFMGSALVILMVLVFFITREKILILALPLVGYGFAWGGHFFFEKNKPATFNYPFYSFLGDWVMFGEMLGQGVVLALKKLDKPH